MISTILHRITDTHVAHHLSPSIPHYYAKRVTDILQREMGADYRRMPRCRSFAVGVFARKSVMEESMKVYG